jgi:hypothetical protein
MSAVFYLPDADLTLCDIRHEQPVALRRAASNFTSVLLLLSLQCTAIDRLVHHSTIFELNVESYRRRKASDKQSARRRQLPDDDYDGGATTMN